jgi:hypothetical protein
VKDFHDRILRWYEDHLRKDAKKPEAEGDSPQ